MPTSASPSQRAIQARIDKMLQAGILKPVHQATPWINSFVLVEGKDKLGKLKLRISLDPTNLNKAIVCEPYHFKTPEDIAHLLADTYDITIGDCRKGYWHQQLDEASSFLTTFNTELGRFCYTVMPFVATVAVDVFQCKLDEYFRKIEQVIIIADDIMIAGCKPDPSSHDQTFTNLLQAAKECNMKLNYDKLQYKQKEVKFFSETYTTNGHNPSKDKVTAITSIPSPTNKKQVQSFIDMINYLAKFSLRLSEIVEIREPAKDRVPSNWGSEHQEAFSSLKKEIASAPVLAYYNSKKQTTLLTDPSIKGLEACLLQDSKPVYFTSKALTNAQKGYVASELEALVIAWAIESSIIPLCQSFSS